MRPCPRSISRAVHARAVVSMLVLGMTLTASAARAGWPLGGTPLTPQPPDYNQQYLLRGLLPDGSGGAYVTWLSSFTIPQADQTNYALVAQRVDVQGNRPAPWTAAGSNILTWISSPGNFGIYAAEPVALVPDGGGGAVHALVSASMTVEPHTNFNLHHVQPNGTVTGFPLFTGDFSGGPPPAATAADGDGAGGVLQIVRAQTFAPPLEQPPPQPLMVRRIAPDGTTPWSIDNLVPPGQATGALAALGDGTGGGWFAWIDLREAGDPDVYVVRLTAGGAPAPGWPPTGVLACGATGAQFEPHLATRDGGVYVIWRDERDGSSRLYVQHLLPDGGLGPGMPADGVLIPSADGDDRFLDASADAEGGLFLLRSGKNSNVSIAHLHRLGGAAGPMAGWPATGLTLNDVSFGWTDGLAADDGGGAYVSFRNASPAGLYAQHFAGDGSVAPGWPAAGVLLSGTGFSSKLVRSGPGAMVAWDDGRSDWPGVYAQRIVTDGVVAAELALVDASATPERVALRWFAADGAGRAVTIERSTGSAGWSTLADGVVDGSGTLRYEDSDVVTGTRYGYRVAWTESGTLRTSGETWVTVPATLAFALETPIPNPSGSRVTLALALPDARPARLDVHDLAGRRVASRDLTGLGAGRHVLSLPEVNALPAGLYVVRLARGGETRTVRLLRAP